MHSLTGYPLLPFGVVTEGADAEPLFDREKPPTDSEKRSLALVMMPLYESMNRARLQAAKVSSGTMACPASDPSPNDSRTGTDWLMSLHAWLVAGAGV